MNRGPVGRCTSVLLLSRTWPQRAFIYASLMEAGVDVYGVDHPEEAQVAPKRWPRRFGLLLFDVGGYGRDEVARTLGSWGEAGAPALVLAGPFEAAALPSPLPPQAERLHKPVSVEEVVDRVRRRLGAA